ncbi:hypothetical protein BHE74_00055470 [Ensete ventricosum]|nr:hypothetical protein BHE74_00055470 [Ensete ventricosum]
MCVDASGELDHTLGIDVVWIALCLVVLLGWWDGPVTCALTSSGLCHTFPCFSDAYAATPISLKIIDLYVVYAITTAVIQVVYMGIVGSFPFNSFLSGVLSCVGTAVLAVCLRIQVNKENKEFKDLPPERAFADFVLCNLVLHLVIMNFLG